MIHNTIHFWYTFHENCIVTLTKYELYAQMFDFFHENYLIYSISKDGWAPLPDLSELTDSDDESVVFVGMSPASGQSQRAADLAAAVATPMLPPGHNACLAVVRCKPCNDKSSKHIYMQLCMHA